MSKPVLKDVDEELQDDEKDIKDLTIVGSDGGSVRVSKTILAAQSPVFHRMFFGNFRESRKDCNTLELIYTTSTLQEMADFCYTGKTPSARVVDERSVSALVDLLDAVNYFGMMSIYEVISSPVEWKLEFIFVLLQQLLDRGLSGEKLWDWSILKLKNEHLFWVSEVEGEEPPFGKISFLLLEAIFNCFKNIKTTNDLGLLFAPFLASALKIWSDKNEELITEEEQARLQSFVDEIGILRLSDVVPAQYFWDENGNSYSISAKVSWKKHLI